MKRFIAFATVLLAVATTFAEARREKADNEWTIVSPEGGTTVTVTLHNGELTYSAGYVREGKYTELLESSPLGFESNVGNFAQKLMPISAPTIQEQKAEYTLRASKRAQVSERYTRFVLPVQNEKKAKQRMTLEMWVGNAKVAFRYLIPQIGDTAAIVIKGEKTGFNLPDESTTFICPQSDPMIGWKRTKPSYEEEYVLDGKMSARSKYGHGYTFPCLFRVGDKGWVEISETGLTSDYVGCRLSEGNSRGLYTIEFPMEGENNGWGSNTAQMGLPGATPWRTITLAPSLAPIVESTVTWDVVEPLYTPSTDYKGGRSTWSWIIWQDESIVYKDQIAYIDLAAEMGWEYCLIDGGWMTNIGREGMERLFDYCREKGIRPWVWYNSNGGWNDAPQCAKSRMHNPIVRKQEMAWLKKGNVAGIKVDFFAGDKQETIRLYEQILSDANDYGIQVIFHGCTLPRGWEKMYPNYCSSEAVLASENLVFNQYWDDKEGENACLHPFIRNAVGSMEFGGTVLQKRLSRSGKKGTRRIVGDCFELATAIAFQSSVQNFAMTPLTLTEAPQFEIDFMKQVPTEWQDTRLLDGYPGKFVAMARQATDGKWYIALMNAQKEAHSFTLNLSSLGIQPGTTLSLLTDGEKGGAPTQATITVNKKGVIKLTVGPQSGAVICN